jgi:hypothetical protein
MILLLLVFFISDTPSNPMFSNPFKKAKTWIEKKEGKNERDFHCPTVPIPSSPNAKLSNPMFSHPKFSNLMFSKSYVSPTQTPSKNQKP